MQVKSGIAKRFKSSPFILFQLNQTLKNNPDFIVKQISFENKTSYNNINLKSAYTKHKSLFIALK